jgi:addiction module RelE/StbE family toxin
MKDLERVPNAMRSKVEEVAKRLDAEPALGGKLKGKLVGLRSAHVGRSYRIIYQLDGPVATVLTVLPRKDAYR